MPLSEPDGTLDMWQSPTGWRAMTLCAMCSTGQPRLE